MRIDSKVLFKIKAHTAETVRNLSALKGQGQKVDKPLPKSVLFSGATSKMAGAAMDKVTKLFVDLSGTIMRSSDAATKFEQTMQFAGVKDDRIKEISESVEEFSRTSIFAIDDLLNTTSVLAANGVNDADKMTKALGGLTAAAGGNGESFKKVALAYTNVVAKGKLMSEDWDLLVGAIPGGSQKIQDALQKNGAYTGNFREALSKGQISAQDFKKAVEDVGLTKLAQDAATSTDTFEGIFANIQSTLVTFGKDLLKAIGEENIKQGLKDFQKALNDVLNTVIGLTSWFSENKDVIQNFVLPIVAAIAIVIGSVLLLASAIGVLQFTLGLLLGNPIVLALTAIIAIILLVIQNFDAIKEKTQEVSTVIGVIFAAMGDIIGNVFNGIKDSIKNVVAFFASAFNAPANTVKGIFNSIASSIKGVFNGVVGFIKGIINGVIGGINFVIDGINAIGSPIKFGHIPKLGKGGVVKRPTQAIIGEAGPEAIVPLTPKGISKFTQGIGMSSKDNSETNYVFNITTNKVDDKSIESLLRRKAVAQGW